MKKIFFSACLILISHVIFGQFTITANTDINGTIDPSGIIPVNSGDNLLFTISPNTGYHIAVVLDNGISVGNSTTYAINNITSSHIVYASFDIDTFSITTNSGANGDILPAGPVSATYGSSQTFNIIPNSGFQIADVTVDGTSIGVVSSYTFDNISADHSISATFVNYPPVAAVSDITGIPQLGQVLTGNYTYSDSENDQEGSSVFQWLRYDLVSGGTPETIAGATSQTYTVTLDDVGKYLSFMVIPVALTGTTPGLQAESPRVEINAAPVATIEAITGTPQLNQTLTGNYSYADLENDPEGVSSYQWLRYDLSSGGAPASIPGATSQTYTVTAADVGKYLSFTVIPDAQTGATPGIQVESPRIEINAAPVASVSPITGIPQLSQVLTGSYVYSDLENDPEGISVFQWLRYDGASGGLPTVLPGATSTTYVVTMQDVGKYLSFTVTPLAQTGASPGIQVESPRVEINAPPVAIIGAITGIPQLNQTLTGNYSYADLENDPEGVSSYQWLRYDFISGGTPTPIPGATSLTYTVTLTDVGKYLSFTVIPVAQSGATPGLQVESPRVEINAAPVANVSAITGSPQLYQVLTGNYVYTDLENDPQGVSTYQWLRYDVAAGGTPTVITGATSITYTVTLADVNKYLSFTVVPVAQTGTTPGLQAESIRLQIGNKAPVASLVSISGTPNLSQLLTGNYTYSDLEADPEGISAYRWLRYSGSTGGSATVIATTKSYLVTLSDVGSYLSFEVTPVASTGTLTGLPVESSRLLIANVAPVASNVSITGTFYDCKKLTGNYMYSDLESNPEQGSTYRWYRAAAPTSADTVFIAGATGLTYTLTDTDVGKYMYFRVTPRSSAGTVNGIPVLSSPTTIINKSTPRVTLTSTQSTMCQGQSTSINMAFSGTPPYRLVYTDGSAEHLITTSNDLYTLSITKGGNYKGDTLTDANSCPITDLASHINITVNPLPVVGIVGLNAAYSLSAGPVSLQGNPAGGTFSGDGVVPSANLFYPSLAGVAGSPHAIVYTYSSPSTGCKNSDTVYVNIINANAFINGLRTTGKYCNYDTPFIITGGNSLGTIGSFTISGGVGLTDHGNNTATINPSQLPAGGYIISYTYFNNVSLTITQSITVESFATPVILGVNQSNYCSNNARIQLAVNNNYSGGVASFSGNGVGKNSNGTYYFDPSVSSPGKASINFAYLTTYGCKVADSVVVQVFQAPDAQFEVQNYCWNGDSTSFINLTSPVSNVNYWEWHFGDKTAFAYRLKQKHLYASSGDYAVVLIARNTNNCSDTLQKNIHLSDIPKVNFGWKSECFVSGIPVFFENMTTYKDSVTGYKWVVIDPASGTSQFKTKNIQYIYPDINTYPVKLVASNVIGCSDSITKTIPLRPIYSLKDSTYLNTFESSQGYWLPENSVNNWTWGKPGGIVIDSAYSGKNAYYTSFVLPRTNEQLVVTSPCFDFSGVSRPFVQIGVNVNSTSKLEGAVLQYAIDTAMQWNNVGSSGTGINWYNDNSIAALPGGQVSGWSGSTGWLLARNNLDALNGLKYVQFRVVYGSSSTSVNNNGFAFDDFFIGQRSKTVLFEHFTDMSSPGSLQSNTEVDDVLQAAAGDAVGIEYHTSFKVTDTLTSNQSAARVLYYGVGSIPQCFMDGGIDPKYVYNFSSQIPNLNDINTRTLVDAEYSITFNKDKSSQQPSGTVTVKALKNIPYREVYVYIAIVEDIKVQSGSSVVTFNNVLKTLLPSTGASLGYFINQGMLKGQVINIPYNWPLQNVYNVQNLKLVAFIQDNSTKEVYQAAGTDAGLVVDVQNLIDPRTMIFDATVYPNPVKDKATIVFGKELPEGYQLMLIGPAGNIIKETNLLQGIQAIELNVSGYSDGMYFIRVYNVKKNVNKYLKLIIRQ